MRTIYVSLISACVAVVLGAIGGYLYATGSFSGETRTADPATLKHTTDEFRMAAFASGGKGTESDFRKSRQIGLVDAAWAQGRSGLSGAADTTGAALDTLLSYVGTTERGDNRGPAVERFLAHVGLGPGYAYCAAAVSYCLDAPPDSMRPILPKVRSATAQDFESGISVDADVAIKMGLVPQGWIHVYQKGEGPYGHNGFVQHWRGQCGRTVEANTSRGRYGNQRDGQGIWERRRCYNPQSYFHLDVFTPTIYPRYDFSDRSSRNENDHLQVEAIEQDERSRRPTRQTDPNRLPERCDNGDMALHPTTGDSGYHSARHRRGGVLRCSELFSI